MVLWSMCKSFGGGDRLVVAAASAIMHTGSLVVTADSSVTSSAIIHTYGRHDYVSGGELVR